MVDSVRYGFRSVLNSQHGDFNGFFNGFQASKSWNAGRYLNKRRTGWWHQCWHVVRPGVILQQLDEWDDWTQWVGNPMEQVGACLAGHPPGCSWFFLREGAYIKWCQWPQQNWWLMTDWSSDDWRWSPGTSKAIQYRFSHPNSWFALWMFLKLGAPRYITQGDICFLCVCVFLLNLRCRRFQGGRREERSTGGPNWGIWGQPLAAGDSTMDIVQFLWVICVWTHPNLDHILDKFGSINQFWPNVMEYQMRVCIQ